MDTMDTVGYCTFIEAQRFSGYDWKASVSCLQDVGWASLQVDVHLLSASTSACEKANQWLHAVELLEMCQSLDVQSDEVIHNAILSASARRSWRFALALTSAVEELRLTVDMFGLSSVISSKLSWDISMNFLERSQRCSQTSEACHNSFISACEMGSWRLALSVLYSLPSLRIIASCISFNSAISVCAESQEWGIAMQHFQSMSDLRLQQDEFSFNSLTKSLEEAGKWELALALLNIMADKKRLVPDEYSYNAAINACKFAVRLAARITEAKGRLERDPRPACDIA